MSSARASVQSRPPQRAALAVLPILIGLTLGACAEEKSDPYALRHYRKPPPARRAPVAFKTRVYGRNTTVGTGTPNGAAAGWNERGATLGRQGSSTSVSGSAEPAAPAASGNWGTTSAGHSDHSSGVSEGVYGDSTRSAPGSESGAKYGNINP
ncbi:MAG: hypothetical protein U1A27_06310 [Phycisphaerae bacterium]